LTVRDGAAYLRAVLREGARIAVVAPGGAVSPERLEFALTWIEARGWVPVPAPHLHDRHRYLAGRREDRAADLAWALTAPDFDALWFARGGYGTAQVLAAMPWDRVVRRPVIGFSDATPLLWALARRGLPTIHGPVLTNLPEGPHAVDEESRAALVCLLTTGEGVPLPGALLCGPAQTVRGPLVGGNLTVLASLAGTGERLCSAGAVVILEDVGEAPYRVERVLAQLLDSGALDGAAGVAFGEFVDCQPPEGAGYALAEIWAEHLAPLGIPVLHGLPVGHGSKNLAFCYGAEAELSPAGVRPGLWRLG
jgi:muramoyltetrapeptide carboxypeptidase